MADRLERALQPPTRAERIVFWIVRSLVVLLARVVFRTEVVGREHLPTDRPFILAPIHRSNLDSPLVAILTRQRMRFMGKDSMWKFAPVEPLLHAIGGFPVHRGEADREAMRAAVSMLDNGEPLVMFPEGTRCWGPTVHPLFDGPAYVASRTGVDIVPVGIGGSERAWPKGKKLIRPTKLSLVVGEPIPAPCGDDGKRVPRRAVRETTERLAEELQALYDRAQALVGTPNPPRP